MTQAFTHHSGSLRTTAGALCLAALAACTPVAQSERPGAPEPGVFAPTADGPKDAPKGTCWGRTVSPAVVETVTEQIQVKPAKVNPDGTVTALPEYRIEERQVIVTPRVDNWFETPCAEALTEEFNASLQRALQARGSYGGAITGKIDAMTREAVQVFQTREIDLASPVLSVEAARILGLIAVPRTP